MKKLYIIGPKDRGEGAYALIADDGEFLASHFCSHYGYAKGDLHDRREERKAQWKERFGDYQVLFLGEDEMTEDRLVELNKEWYDRTKNAAEIVERERPKITITLSD